MKITIKYFASIRESIGSGHEVLETQSSTLDELKLELISKDDAHARALGQDQVVRVAMNQRVCDGHTPLVDGAEVAFFPPVTGG